MCVTLASASWSEPASRCSNSSTGTRPIAVLRISPKPPDSQTPALRVEHPRSSRSRPPGAGHKRVLVNGGLVVSSAAAANSLILLRSRNLQVPRRLLCDALFDTRQSPKYPPPGLMPRMSIQPALPGSSRRRQSPRRACLTPLVQVRTLLLLFWSSVTRSLGKLNGSAFLKLADGSCALHSLY